MTVLTVVFDSAHSEVDTFISTDCVDKDDCADYKLATRVKKVIESSLKASMFVPGGKLRGWGHSHA